jgi:hypothetical protein
VKKEKYCLTVDFLSLHNGDRWTLTNIYGPCVEPDRSIFIDWFRNCDVNDSINWLFLGDFNFYRSLENRNRTRGNVVDTLSFNDAIGHLGLIELPIKGRASRGAICNQIPFLSNWTGFSPHLIGHLITRSLRSFQWPRSPQIISPAEFQ